MWGYAELYSLVPGGYSAETRPHLRPVAEAVPAQAAGNGSDSRVRSGAVAGSPGFVPGG
jgi:hypothetical protein